MASPMLSSQFSTIVSPILSEAFDGIYEQFKLQYPEVFKVKDGIERNQHPEPLLTGFGVSMQFGNGEAISYDRAQELYVANYLYNTYGLAYAITRELQEDGDGINFGKTFSEQLGISQRETEEITAANVLNRGFNNTFAGGDGVSLFNSSHPVLTGLQSNILATPASLSQTSVEQLITQIYQTKDSNGKSINTPPKKLVVAPANALAAEVILKTVGRSGTANNDLNPIKSRGEMDTDPVMMTRLTSPQAWFIKTDNITQGLQFLWRTRSKFETADDFETKSLKGSVRGRWAAYWTDWRDCYGTSGV